MNGKLVQDVANAVLYEGYMLYPYRTSAVKNRQRWNFGVLYPRSFSESQQGVDAWSMQTECLLRSNETRPTVTIRVRFLHLTERDGNYQQAWQEGIEREVSILSVDLVQLTASSMHQTFTFGAAVESEGEIVRTREEINGRVEVDAEDLGTALFKLRIRVFNTASLAEGSHVNRDRAVMRSLVSAHIILKVDDGEFISLLDPPDEAREPATRCKNIGNWPVLVGEVGERDAMLCSPIILYDYPQIAPESAGSLFDGTETDEILTLRIMTLTDDEKLEMGQGDDRARQILERTESMPPEQLMKMHGALRRLRRADQEMP